MTPKSNEIMKDIDQADIIFGEGVVVIKRRGVTQPSIAVVLGAESDLAKRTSRVWLDRMVHTIRDNTLGGWQVSGAISTILTKDIKSP